MAVKWDSIRETKISFCFEMQSRILFFLLTFSFQQRKSKKLE